MRIRDIQQFIKKMLIRDVDAMIDLVDDAKKIATELLTEATSAEHILQYIEGAILEILIIATMLSVDVERVLSETLRRIEAKRLRFFAE